MSETLSPNPVSLPLPNPISSSSNLQPGGYVETKEAEAPARSDDDSIPKSSTLRVWEEKCREACVLIGQPLDVAENLKRWIEEAGFVDVEERLYKLPMNTWPKDEEFKELGRYQYAQYMDALKPFALGLLVEVLGWTLEETEVFLMELRKDIANRRYHGYNLVYVLLFVCPLRGGFNSICCRHVITGRKPFDSEKAEAEA